MNPAFYLLFCVAFLCACQIDHTLGEWDVGTDGNVDADVGGDTQTEPKLIPQDPPEDSVCHKDWCWLAPQPFGHSVDHLRQAGDEVYGVARVGSVRGFEPFVWGDDVDILETPQVDGASLTDMTTTADGWLALRTSREPMAQRTVYDLGQGGLRNTIELPDGCASKIAGSSADRFVVWQEVQRRCIGANGFAFDRGQSYELDTDYGVRFWPNGDVWAMGLSAPDKLHQNWSIQSLDGLGPVVGPAPTSDCDAQGRWMAGSGDSVYWWTEDRGSWWENHKLRVVIRDFGCSADQQVTAVSEDGRFHRRVGEQEWESEHVSETGLHSMLSKDGTTYIAGESGALLTRTDGETRKISEPFGPLNDDSPEDIELQRVTDIWVSPDGTDAVLLDQERLYRKTQEDWEHVRVGSPAQPSQGVEQIWGRNSPQLMTRSGAVYRWNGAVWEATAEDVLSAEEPVVDIDGHSPSKMWVAESRGLALYDGQSWVDLATPGSTLQSELQARDADISDIDAAADGTLLLAVGQSVLGLTLSGDDVQLETIADSPCGAGERVFQTEGGTLFVGTESGCLASRTDGSWQTQDISPRRVREFEPDAAGASPLVVTDSGVLKRGDDGSYAETFRGATVAASAVPGLNAVVLAHRKGLLLKHD